MLASKEQIKVGLEASYLGHGFVDEEGRTGVYRVASELVKRFLVRPDVSAYLGFIYLPHSATLAMNYLKKEGYNARVLYRTGRLEEKVYRYLQGFPQIPHKYGVMLYVAKLLQWPKEKKLNSNIDIFHSFYFPLPGFVDPKKNIRFITIHDIIFLLFPQSCQRFQRRRLKSILKSIDIHNDWVICVSQCTKSDFCEMTGMLEERVFVIYLGASKDIYYPIDDFQVIRDTLKHFGIPDDKDYFLSVATIEPRKNLASTVRCFKRILNEPGLSDMYLVVVGRLGWKVRDFLKELKTDPILRSRVILTGFVEERYLAPLYSGAVAFLYPSLYEGFGLPPLEAMQCGTPVITSNISSLPEVVGDAAIMIDPRDENDLCHSMVEIARNSALRKQLSVKGIKRARLFSWDRCVDKTIKAYRFALENR